MRHRAIERRLRALEQQTRPDVIGIWDTEDGDVVEVGRQRPLLETVTVATFRKQYPDGMLLKITHGEPEGAT